MYSVPIEILKKHEIALEAARKYWVLNQPTGMSDAYFNKLEAAAREDGLELRDYVCQEIQGTRSQNADYIPKVEKQQVPGDMLSAIEEFDATYSNLNPGKHLYWIPKYDGSSLAAYYDVSTGRCVKVITIGGSNLGNLGIDQTEKFAKFFPDLPNTGVKAIQAECLISLEHGFGENSRQKANGLVNASYEPMDFNVFVASAKKTRTDKDYKKYLEKFEKNLKQVQDEVDKYINIRAFRYFIDDSWTTPVDYKAAMESIPAVFNNEGDIKFCSGFINTLPELKSLFGSSDGINKDIWTTPSGTFLIDGLVAYTQDGVCVKALKYKDAGRGESTLVLGIRWNNQVSKGKDSWSANALIEPVTIRGSVCTKPTIGSVTKMVTNGISRGARVNLILANSTIPAISEVLEPGNGDYEWPVCSCGYQMSEKDIFGSNLKCGNPVCSERLNRMKNYLWSLNDISDINLNKLLIIDRVDLNSNIRVEPLVSLIINGSPKETFKSEIENFLTTDLQKRNLELVYQPAYLALYEWLKYKNYIK